MRKARSGVQMLHEEDAPYADGEKRQDVVSLLQYRRRLLEDQLGELDRGTPSSLPQIQLMQNLPGIILQLEAEISDLARLEEQEMRRCRVISGQPPSSGAPA